ESALEADAALRRALELNGLTSDAQERVSILRDLIATAQNLKRSADIDRWFDALVKTGTAMLWDWRNQATRLDAAKRFAEGGRAWQQAALLSKLWSDFCEAAGSFDLASDNEDSVLYFG